MKKSKKVNEKYPKATKKRLAIAEVFRVSGCFSLPHELEEKAAKILLESKKYNERGVFEAIKRASKVHKIKIDDGELKEQLGIQ